MKDNINPAHYQQGGIETIDFMQAKLSPEEFRGYLKANIFKYVTREGMKNGLEDLQKAQWYLDRLIALDSNTPFKSRAEIDKIVEKHDTLETGLHDMLERAAKETGVPRQFLFGHISDGGIELEQSENEVFRNE
ncbi:hypothetical protein PWEIH_00490 [Listeria weihenstephanensis FSL R9-0317]|uniref:DUF3310 domain-containing protein n=1 Tax=Listeria weihenstephanensis TaxID=1006155 RepID=UPI0003E85B0C|nr:DUF3310 domain-containing protein [Listeria weihenstephanensis]EUJ41496.1 hypothetical protein PWEIH_00490 [Listeria weihenstephanensis FSL R9-0317]